MSLAALRPLDDPSERQSRRFRLLISAAGSISQSRDVAVVLHNLSMTGLLIECEAAMEVGASIVLSLPDLGEVEALVVWNSDGYYGAAFRSPLSRSAVEMMLSSSKVVWPAFNPMTAEAPARQQPLEPVEPVLAFAVNEPSKPPMIVRTVAIVTAAGLLWTLVAWAALSI